MPYSKVGITIPSVTGNVVITVTTSPKSTPVTNLFVPAQATINTRFTSSSTAAQNGMFITGYIDAVGGDVIYVKTGMQHPSSILQKVNCYGTTDTKIGAKVLAPASGASNVIYTIIGDVGYFTVPEVSGATRIKICLFANITDTAISAADIADWIITKNEPIS